MSTPKQKRQFRRRTVIAVTTAVFSAAAVTVAGLAVFGVPSGAESAGLAPGTSTSTTSSTSTVPPASSTTSTAPPPDTVVPTPDPAPPTPTSVPVVQNTDPDVGAAPGTPPPPPAAPVVPTTPPLALSELSYVGWMDAPYIEGFTARQWHYEANGLPDDVVCAAIERDIAAGGYAVTTKVCDGTVYFEFSGPGWQGFAKRSSPGGLRDLVYVEARQL
jgi:hypothetical protein